MATSREELRLSEARLLVPRSVRPSSSQNWPDPIMVNGATKQLLISIMAQHLDLSDPNLSATVLTALRNSPRLRGPLAENDSLPFDLRRELAGTNPQLGLPLLLQQDVVPVQEFVQLLAGPRASFNLLETALEQREDLRSTWAQWSEKNQRMALSSLLCTVDMASTHLDTAKLRSSSRVREIWHAVTFSPVLPRELREVAFERRTGQWTDERRATARIAFDSIPFVPWPWDAERLASLSSLELTALVGWATNSVGHHLDTPPTSMYRSDLAIQSILSNERGMAAMRFLNIETDSLIAERHERRLKQPSQELIGLFGYTPEMLIASVVWDRPVIRPRRVDPHELSLANWLQVSARAVLARKVLGKNQGAWETMLGLAINWEGSFGQLLLAAKALA